MGWWIYILSSISWQHNKGPSFGTPPPALLPELLSSWTRHRARDLPVPHIKRKLACSSKRCNQKDKLWFIPLWIMAPWLNYPSAHPYIYSAIIRVGWSGRIYSAGYIRLQCESFTWGLCPLNQAFSPFKRPVLENHLSLMLPHTVNDASQKVKKFNLPDSSSEALSNIGGS